MRRHGFTLLDQLLGLVLLALLLGIAFRGVGALRDTLAVRAGARAIRDALALAREQAIAGGTRVAVRFGRDDGTLAVHAGGDSLHRLSLTRTFGVALEATRDSTAYLPSGLGVGGANLTVVLRRGARADTVTVSRLGRVR
jgi:Tfp pilus assembly protein FimT